MGDSEKKPLSERVADLEESVQSFGTKAEYGGAKADAAGATAAATGAAASATGISAEVTGLGTGLKLWSFEYDLKAELEKKRDKTARRDPEKLRLDLDADRTDIDRIKTNLTTTGERITTLSEDVERKLRRKADASDVGDTRARQDRQLEGLRSSQVNALRREAEQAGASVQVLEREINRLNSVF
ncbi:hypothetical protein [Streptomyces sp. NPDC002564]|uniref:hypothetical protein n=1 Tax=Streptomyces sp. NPDC002564 TaxID=3364649 RepID=UPI0036CEF6B6